MATAFGLTALRTKLADWRGGRKGRGPSDSEIAAVEPMFSRVVVDHDDGDISKLIESQIIPRLVANQTMRTRVAACNNGVAWPDARESKPGAPIFSASDIHQFAQLSAQDNPEAMLDFIDVQLSQGQSVETIYVELLAPAARKLGNDWEDDRLGFIDVTMGLWRIQEILRQLSSRRSPLAKHLRRRRSALFTPMPTDQHSLGTLMMGDCFERAGWSTEVLIEPSHSELNVKCAGQHFDLVGLTVSCDCSTDLLRSVVRTIKSVSKNPKVCLLLGGRYINENPELVSQCGADGTAIDALSALALADRLVPVSVERVESLA
jgi:methanogenic corrinoid protein MtbC1